jgi:hypothetical protein
MDNWKGAKEGGRQERESQEPLQRRGWGMAISCCLHLSFFIQTFYTFKDKNAKLLFLQGFLQFFFWQTRYMLDILQYLSHNINKITLEK